MENANVFTCSMTRANKLLAQLREGSSTSVVPRRGRYTGYSSGSSSYHKEVGLLFYTDETQLNNSLQEIRTNFEERLLKKKLIERWKNKLFELNIHYGIHKVLSNIDILQQEKSMVTEALQATKDNNCITVPSVVVSMNACRDSEKKYDFRWNVGAFEQDELNKRLKEISKEVSKLDELKDKLNIENSFSIDLSTSERALLNI